MNELPPFGTKDWLAVLLAVALALGLRAGYLLEATDEGRAQPAWLVQNDASSPPPLSPDREASAYRSPGYPWLLELLPAAHADVAVRWAQCGLGALTAGLYFLFARRVFCRLAVALFAGLLTALHPWWIVNVGEIADGVLVSFLLAAALFLGTRASQVGGAFTSLLLGVILAALALVRAALLPFAMAALLWFLLRCRTLRQGWLCALLAVLGMANGLAPWMVQNLQTFGQPLPIVSSTWLHLYMGNNPRATGGQLSEAELRASLPPGRVDTLLREPNQARRYDALAHDVIAEVVAAPADACNRRLLAGVTFVFGEPWLRDRTLGEKVSAFVHRDVAPTPPWVDEMMPGLLAGSLLLMALLGLWGWRRSFPWRRRAALATLATILLPLPYLLGHAGPLAGPRLPLDGVWLTYAALALACVVGLGPNADAESAGASRPAP